MNKFKKMAVCIIGMEFLLLLALNGLYLTGAQPDEGRIYRVEASRVAKQLQTQNIGELDLSRYPTIVGVREFVPGEEGNYDYVVKQAGDTLYRIEYVQKGYKSGFLYMNLALAALLSISVIGLVYIWKKIIQPFYNIRELPAKLAKGNLTVPVKEEKSKFLGGFLWGMDMLREKLESNKEREMELQKEKKTLLLSLTHDIKTPLSAIKLYARAVADDLYDTKEKKQEALAGIQKNVEDIENYVKEINKAAREDFLNQEVEQGEFYASELLDTIWEYYREKLALLHTEFVICPGKNCLLKGDKNRMTEVLQNIMENAIKYGDGKSVSISGEDEEDCRLITVSNTGCSLKEEEFSSLFDSFYRGSNSQGIKGSGLGLYICKKLMQQMDGEIFAGAEQGSFKVTMVIRKV